jgi:hypothetical protein
MHRNADRQDVVDSKEEIMLSKTRSKLTGLLAVAIVVALAGIAIAGTPGTRNTAAARAVPAVSVPTGAEIIASLKTPDGGLSFDVAENMNRFVFDKDVAFDDGMPKHGSTFITQGYIYPAGTLTETNGVLADGSPEFPEKVLGQWTCRGWFVGDGAHAKSGPMVITTQLYNFGGTVGTETLVSEGYELADAGVTVDRAITGGTGEHVGAYGVAHQTLLGFNASEGGNLHFEIDAETE